MASWLLRGLGMGVLHALAAVLVAKAAVHDPTGAGTPRIVAIAALVGAAALWSAVDAWLGRPDRGRNWFVAALVAGPVAGVLSVAARAMFVDETGMSELGPALTGGAAFTALLVLVPAGLGLFVGTRLDRKPHPEPRIAKGAPDEPEDSGSAAKESTPKPRRSLIRRTGSVREEADPEPAPVPALAAEATEPVGTEAPERKPQPTMLRPARRTGRRQAAVGVRKPSPTPRH